MRNIETVKQQQNIWRTHEKKRAQHEQPRGAAVTRLVQV
jgi:hypothetical protein